MAETLLGLSLEQARGQVLEAIYRLRPHPLAVPGEADRGLAMLCRADGRSIPVEETRSPILDDRGGRLGTAVVFRDVSQRQRAEEALSQSLAKLRHTLDETVNALTVTSEKRDPFTAGHQERVSRLAVAIAAELGLPEEAREGVRVAGLVHDIGKIHVPSEILAKPEALSDMEMGIVKHHCEVGREILQNIPFPWPVARMVLEHHERLDGSGYPAGLVGNAALVESRILAVADVVEAMNAHRPYRAALGLARALEELRTFRGALYDPDVVDACLRLFQTSAFAF